MKVSELRDLLKQHEAALKTHHVKSLAVFGSIARGEAKDSSDIDLLVEFDTPVGMFEFLELQYYLEKILSSRIDLATQRALHPGLRDIILKEAVRVA
jgi:predicted nucleotidyltransferase